MALAGYLRMAAALAANVLVWGQGAAPPVPRNVAEAEKLEAQVSSKPDDAAARAQLIRLYAQSRVVTDKAQILRGQHILWMIEHDPGNAVLGEPAGTLDPQGQALPDPYAYAQADRAWRHLLTRADAAAPVLANAAFFYRSPEPAFARQIASGGLKRFPRDPKLGAVAGGLDALAILGATAMDGSGTAISFDERLMSSPEAVAARREVETSMNVSRVGAVTSFLMQQVPSLRARLQPPQMKAILDLAARCYERAIAIEPENAVWKSGLRSVYRTAASTQVRPADRYVYLERAARVPATEAENLLLFPELAQARMDARDLAKAAEAAQEALRLAETNPGAGTGNAVHIGNTILGRLAMQRGDIAEAKTRLLAAGHTSGSPALNTAGPDLRLAQELLAKGEKAVVLEYLELCRTFWRRGNGKLDLWTAAIRAGEWPEFGLPGR